MSHEEPRQSTPIDAIAESWVETLVQLKPEVGTYIGRTDVGGRYGDYSPAGHEAYIEAASRTLRELRSAAPVDAVDRVTQTDLSAELELDLASSEAGLQYRDLNVIASPSQELRDVFDLMPTATVEDWSTIRTRLGALPDAVDGYIETLREGIARGITPARRQVAEVYEQVLRTGADDGFFIGFAANAGPADGQLPASLAAELSTGAGAAAVAYNRLADFLAHELLPAATQEDAIGRELYALQSRRFLGATVDLDESYEWGIEELARMVSEQEAIANEILPGASVEEAVAFLEQDPARKLHGTDALQRWMQETSDRAVEELGRTHFDIPQEIRALECMIAPTQEGGIYYTGPTDDFSRPGRMWWSVPAGVTEFDTWRELTTVYHEGVPGHHLQIGQAVVNRKTLNLWRRQLAGTSGHAEGWALYAERLMEQLGYLDDPADRLGMLDGQRMRAARVVLDIGVHLGKPLPDGSGTWTAEYAFDFMGRNVNMSPEFVRFEVNRYLGWPGQAPSYKIGQRIWEQLRDDAARRAGDAFDIKDFHRRALDLGGVGLDTLRSAMLG
ncbi:DUF885 domain-containing protein [Plantibacter sp. VKM Ac-2885]|uniref:Uncharacterized conserved protein, DUF885 familyt n=1 Tax=Plantibacter elymi (nom. nud.) TaxID=199708 RepID=A0ABY1RCE7_9MICO|nr:MULTISPECIES: DUF885 domain-containing protein [Plantibacter]MBD8103024.1 DUF885 domain-containing protein [Plantibacter sp. CFBP 8775]MBF4513078.1 DUF885 domain-containing protein [Plantibacter sp. VKM Ac-2885]TKJ98134.1 DUF885 domain-containing protein [Plantibacter flavus]CAH0148146.1 hypothetical protein SRABI02_00705 [Plantibacter cousiniae]SMQ66723.1 Uncharacterized conserved protein, DUF885 familyt [Plantibacter sp. VKM Ac-1784]